MADNQPKIWLCVECKQNVDFVHLHGIYEDVCVDCSGISKNWESQNFMVNHRFRI